MFHGPFGDGKLSSVDTRDVGAIITEAVIKPELHGKILNLTGPDAFSHSQMAEILSKETGQIVTFVDITEEKSRETMLSYQMPQIAVDALSELYNVIKAGYSAVITNTIEEVLNRKPISFEKFIQENAAAFKSTSKKHTVLVTGASGNIGVPTIQNLIAKGVHVRAAVRQASKADNLKTLGAELIEVDITKEEKLIPNLKDVDTIVMIIPVIPDIVNIGKTITAAAKAAGVKHIVKLSGMGTDQSSITLSKWHAEIEKLIRDTGIILSSVRPNNFYQNLINYNAPTIKSSNAFFGPFGDGKVSYVDTRDVAAVIAELVVKPEHHGKNFTLTGSQALSHTQIAEIISKVTGKTVTFVDIPEEKSKETMLSYQIPEVIVNGLSELYAVMKAGYASEVTTTVHDVLGRNPISLEDFVKEFAAAFS